MDMLEFTDLSYPEHKLWINRDHITSVTIERGKTCISSRRRKLRG